MRFRLWEEQNYHYTLLRGEGLAIASESRDVAFLELTAGQNLGWTKRPTAFPFEFAPRAVTSRKTPAGLGRDSTPPARDSKTGAGSPV